MEISSSAEQFSTVLQDSKPLLHRAHQAPPQSTHCQPGGRALRPCCYLPPCWQHLQQACHWAGQHLPQHCLLQRALSPSGACADAPAPGAHEQAPPAQAVTRGQSLDVKAKLVSKPNLGGRQAVQACLLQQLQCQSISQRGAQGACLTQAAGCLIISSRSCHIVTTTAGKH